MQKVLDVWRLESPILVMAGRLGVTGLGLISALIIARAIGPSGRGETAAAIALFYILPILLAMGVPIEVRRLTAAGRAAGVTRAAKQFALLTCIPALLLAVGFAYTLFREFDLSARLVASIGVAATPLTVSWMCDASVVFARRRFRAFLAIQVAQPCAFLVLIVAMWVTGVASTATVLLANIIGTLLTFAISWRLVTDRRETSEISLGALTRNGVKFAGAAIAEAASNRLDQVLVLPLMGGYQAGLYSVAVTIAAVPIALGHALGGAFFSSIADTHAGSERTRLKADSFRYALVLGTLACGILAVLTPFLISRVFGSSFESAVPATLTALAGTIAMVAAYVVAQGLAAEGKGLRMSLAQVISLIVSIGLLAFLGPSHGALGAAVASSIGYVVLLMALLVSYSVPIRGLIPSSRDVVSSFKALLHGR